MVSAALRAVGNIVTGDDVQTQVILNCSVLPCLLHLLSSQKESIRKEACWTISNITAGNRAQIQVIFSFSCLPINGKVQVSVLWPSPEGICFLTTYSALQISTMLLYQPTKQIGLFSEITIVAD